MADLSQMIRWNANFVRGLAQSVLERAKTIRENLKPSATMPVAVKRAAPAKPKPSTAKRAKLKKTAVKTARKPKRANA